jgi:hypothetical protein
MEMDQTEQRRQCIENGCFSLDLDGTGMDGPGREFEQRMECWHGVMIVTGADFLVHPRIQAGLEAAAKRQM